MGGEPFVVGQISKINVGRSIEGRLKRVQKEKVMPGGWHYEQPFRGATVRINADTYDIPPSDLFTNVLNFRIENGVPVGNVKDDVIEYICSKFPEQCRDVNVSVTVRDMAVQGFRKELVHEVLDWASNTEHKIRLYGYFKRSSNAVAQERSRVCEQCPMNTVYLGKCPRCDAKAGTMLGLMRGAKDVGRWRKLHGCSKLKMCVRTAVWLPHEVLPETDGVDVPSMCWLRQERKKEMVPQA